MKRICALLSIILIMSGCTKTDKMPVAKAGYSCSARFSFENEQTVFATVYALGGGVLKISVTEPENLKDFSFEFSGEEGKICYKDLPPQPISMESCGNFVYINGAFLKLTTASPAAEQKGQEWVYTDSYKSLEFIFMLNSEGLPKSLVYKGQNIEAEFWNWNYQKN